MADGVREFPDGRLDVAEGTIESGSTTLPETFVNLRDQSLGEQIAEAIAKGIIDRSVAPGTKLSEVEIATQFGTSRTPVRDAFRLLASEHLVVVEPRRGVRTLELDARRVADIYLIRSRLHGLGAYLASLRGTTAQRLSIAATVDEMEAAAAGGDVDRFVHANFDFHQQVEVLADSVFLTTSLAGLGRLTVHLRQRGLSIPGRLAESASQHRVAADAILATDASRAERATSNLILTAGWHILVADFPDALTEQDQLRTEGTA